MKRKIQYLNERANGSYRYVRDYPTRLLRLYPEHPKQFSRELGLTNTCSDSELHKAMDESSRLYALNVKMAEASDPEAFTESERLLAVEEVLRQRKLKHGEFAKVPKSQYTKEQWEALPNGATIIPDRHDLAEWSIPEIEDILDDSQRGRRLTFRQEVLGDAWKAIQTLPEYRRRKTMREAWADYVRLKGLDTSKGDGKDKQQRFERVIAFTGDFLISDESKDDVLDRIQSFIDNKQRENPAIKAQSIERELSEFLAAIRLIPRLSWRDAVTLDRKVMNLQLPDADKPVKGRVLTDEELQEFFNTCISKADEKWVCLLVAAHAGLGMREIRRLRPEQDLFLEAKYPHIIFRGGEEDIAKTEARPRVVPIVVGLEVVKQWLPETIRWMNSVDENSPSVTLNKRLRKMLGKEATVKSHMFRHTWLRLCRRARVTEDNKHAIAGWEKGDTNNALMERVYDPHGFADDPELLAQLYEDQQAIFSRFIANAEKANNVVSLKR